MDACHEDIGNLVGRANNDVIDEAGNINNIKEPFVGMIFGSLEEAKRFYEEYGRRKGYATRIRSTYRDRHGPDISSALLVCTCEGVNRKNPVSVDEAKIKRSSTLRTGCKACMRVTNVRGTHAWKVTSFSDQHNHNLFIQSKGDLLKYNRRTSHADKSPSETRRINDVCRQSTRLAYMAGKSEEMYEVIMAVMEETFKKVSEMDKELFKNENHERTSNEAFENPGSPENNSLELMQSIDQEMVQDPLKSQTRGMKRTRTGKEKASSTDILKSGHEMLYQSRRNEGWI